MINIWKILWTKGGKKDLNIIRKYEVTQLKYKLDSQEQMDKANRNIPLQSEL